MLLLVFGSTGPSGQEIIKKALSNGHRVIAYARSAEKIDKAIASQITIVIGELTDNQAILKALDGVDAVISALGPISNHPPGLPITNGYKVIVKCMEQKNVKRLLALSTPSYHDKENDKFSLVTYFLISSVKLFFNQAYQEINGSAEVITSSNLDWTLFRVTILNNSTSDTTLKTGYVGSSGINLTRRDIAKFCIDEIENNKFIRKSPVIYSE